MALLDSGGGGDTSDDDSGGDTSGSTSSSDDDDGGSTSTTSTTSSTSGSLTSGGGETATSTEDTDDDTDTDSDSSTDDTPEQPAGGGLTEGSQTGDEPESDDTLPDPEDVEDSDDEPSAGGELTSGDGETATEPPEEDTETEDPGTPSDGGLTEGSGEDTETLSPEEAEETAADQQAGMGVETEDGPIGDVASDLEQQVLEELPTLTESEIAVQREDDLLFAEITEAGQEQLASAELEEQLTEELGFEAEAGDEFRLVETDEGFQAELSDVAIRRFRRDLMEGTEQLRAFQPADVSLTISEAREQREQELQQAAEGLGLADVQAQEEAALREGLVSELEEDTGAELDPGEDVEFERTDGEIRATLTESGRREVEVSRAPIVTAAEELDFLEPEARAVAGAAAEFRQFGREQREQFVEPALESLREATGLEEEITQFESLQEDFSTAEDEFLRPVREAVSEQVPASLAAGAVVAGRRTASVTPPGRVAAGATLAAGAAAETFQSLPPEQQAAVGTTIAAVTQPQRAAASLLAADGPTDQSELGEPEPVEVPVSDLIIIEIDQDEWDELLPPEIGQLDPEQAPPELRLPIEEAARRERLGDALTFPRDRPLAIQEDPIFLPEILAPTAPADEFTAGRHTPPEVPVDTTEPTEPFGGAEVPLDDDLEGREQPEDFIFPGPEVPSTPGEQEAPSPPPAEAAPQQVLREPQPQVPADPADVARESGPAGPSFVIGRDPRVAPGDPVLETPIADIDLPLVRPELARVLREGPELTAQDPLDATLAGAEAAGRVRPAEAAGIFGFSDQDARDRLAVPELEATDPSERLQPVQDATAVQTPRQATTTATTPRLADPTVTDLPTETPPEFATPTADIPAFDTIVPTATATPRLPGERALPGIELESDDPRRREPELDEFEREFLEPIISPEEALESDDGLPQMDLSGDGT